MSSKICQISPPMPHFYYGTPLFLLFSRMLLFDGGGERRRKRMGKVVHSLSPPLPAAVCNQEDAADVLVVSRLEGEEEGGIFSWLHPTHPFPPPLLWLPNTGGGVLLCCPDPGYGEKGGKIRRWKNRFCGIELPFVRKGVGSAFFYCRDRCCCLGIDVLAIFCHFFLSRIFCQKDVGIDFRGVAVVLLLPLI